MDVLINFHDFKISPLPTASQSLRFSPQLFGRMSTLGCNIVDYRGLLGGCDSVGVEVAVIISVSFTRWSLQTVL